MTQLEARLDPSRFVRMHRSEIVNLDFVKDIQPWFHGDSIVALEERRSASPFALLPGPAAAGPPGTLALGAN